MQNDVLWILRVFSLSRTWTAICKNPLSDTTAFGSILTIAATSQWHSRTCASLCQKQNPLVNHH